MIEDNNYFVFCVFEGRLDDSFSHCVAVWKTKAFKESLEWVTCCVEISEVCNTMFLLPAFVQIIIIIIIFAFLIKCMQTCNI